MSRTTLRRMALVTSVALLGGLTVFSNAETKSSTPAAAVSSGSSNVTIITKPSQSIPISFNLPGVVREKTIKDGDLVKKGQLLMKQDTDIDEKELERLKVEAESNSRIEAAKADAKVKQLEYERKSKAPEGYAASEVEESEAKLIEANKSVNVAEEDKKQAEIKFATQQVKLAKMELHSPVNGIVQNCVIDVGQMADPQNKEGVILLVVNDPLWVELRGLTTLQVSTLKLGEEMEVRYRNEPNAAWQKAKISYISPVADAGADRQLVRLELPNPSNLSAGMNMELNWPKKLLDTAPKDEQILSFTK
jgi:RND family efflux transporter MFP subunit